jgi:hypothetical protein
VRVGIENLLLLAALVGVELAQAHDRAQGLGIEAGAFRFGVHVADVAGGGLFLFLEALDALDKGFQLILGKAGCRLFFCGRGCRHRRLLDYARQTIPAACREAF